MNIPSLPPLCSAVKQAGFTSNATRVESLLKAGEDPNSTFRSGWTVLDVASFHGRLEIVVLLLRFGANVNHQGRGVGGVTALMRASSGGRVEVAKVLLENGADPNMQDDEGTTALSEATKKENATMVRLLLEKGADPNIQDQEGTTALHFCATHVGDTEILQTLLEYSADTTLTDHNGETALELACENHNLSAIFLLFQAGVGLGTF